MTDPIVFWRDGYDAGRGGCYVRGASLNAAVAKWDAEGIVVVGIVIDPAHESNVELILGTPPEAPHD